MKKIFFDQNCFENGPETEESIMIWISYKEEFKDLKDFSKFCINDELKNSIFCESDRTTIVNQFLLASYIISTDKFFKYLSYLEDLKDKSGIKLPSKIKKALHIESEWNYVLCTADVEDYYYGFCWQTSA